jgi:hypothetical protein
MNLLTEEDSQGSDSSEAPAEPAADAQLAAFAGDTSQLRLDTRRVLVQLLLGPSVDVRRQSKLWPVVLRDEAILRSRLNELFLELVIDYEQQVAFTRQASSEDLDVPILLRKANLTLIESALILYLRQRLTQADASGDRAVVSMDDMLEHLAVFERAGNSNKSKFEKQRLKAVEKAKTFSVIRPLPGADERFEVAPTLKLLFSAEQIAALTTAYQDLLAGGSTEAFIEDEQESEQEGGT